MTMSPNIGDREKDKFVEDAAGNTAIRVLSGIQDDDGDKLSINKFGEASITSPEFISIFSNIHMELKLIRLHLEHGSDQEIRKDDL